MVLQGCEKIDSDIRIEILISYDSELIHKCWRNEKVELDCKAFLDLMKYIMNIIHYNNQLIN